ncbi:lactonase family protein [Sinomonas mesophila]|uniref:lactonase family protein n=1 Tax=Sinomonas mesophila TaxID=1531955 RepID=UPI0009877F1F|nr:beta-propeller fold lactonase family protein [Sinomonas mesophila]
MSRILVFIACAGGGAVDTLALDRASGQIEPVSRAEGLGRVSALALDPAGTLYAGANGTPPRTVALALDAATGSATATAESEAPASTCYLALAPGGRELLSASYHEGLMARFPVPGATSERAAGGAAGAARPRATEYRSGPNTHCAVPSPDGRHVYTASLGDDRVSWFPLDEPHDGVVRPAGQLAAMPGSGPRHLRVNAAGDRVYVLHELSGDVDVLVRDPETGGLSLLQRTSAVEGLGLAPGIVRSPSTPDPGLGVVWCADLRLTPDGRVLVATERSTSTLASFTVDADGRLAFAGHTETEAQPRGSAIDPSGQFLLVCGERSDHVTAYRIDPDTGGLEPISRAATAGGPLWIECWDAPDAG